MQVQFSSWAMRRLIDCNWYPMYVKKIFVQLQLVSRYSNIFLSKRDFFALPIYNNMGKTWKLSLTYYVIYVAHNYKPYYLSNGEITLIDTCQTHPIICYFNQCFHTPQFILVVQLLSGLNGSVRFEPISDYRFKRFDGFGLTLIYFLKYFLGYVFEQPFHF